MSDMLWLVALLAIIGIVKCKTCTSGYTYYSSTDSCYKFVSTELNYADATQSCSDNSNGWLVTINDSNENDVVANLCGTTMCWIGYDDIVSEGNFVWQHGTSFYTNWRDGEPNNYEDEDCVDIWDVKWNDSGCWRLRTYVCETEAYESPTVTPTVIPTVMPTALPTAIPTRMPTVIPTAIPTAVPSTSSPTVINSFSEVGNKLSERNSNSLNKTEIITDKANGLMHNGNKLNYRSLANTAYYIITTIAGTGSAAFSGDNSAATSAQIHKPRGIAVDTSGMMAMPTI